MQGDERRIPKEIDLGGRRGPKGSEADVAPVRGDRPREAHRPGDLRHPAPPVWAGNAPIAAEFPATG
jgi:hypothetical protein